MYTREYQAGYAAGRYYARTRQNFPYSLATASRVYRAGYAAGQKAAQA